MCLHSRWSVVVYLTKIYATRLVVFITKPLNLWTSIFKMCHNDFYTFSIFFFFSSCCSFIEHTAHRKWKKRNSVHAHLSKNEENTPSKRTHGGKWFFLLSFRSLHRRRRDEMRERWRNRFSHSISHKIQLWASLISSRLPLIDITFYFIFFYFHEYFSSPARCLRSILNDSTTWTTTSPSSSSSSADSSAEIEKSNC